MVELGSCAILLVSLSLSLYLSLSLFPVYHLPIPTVQLITLAHPFFQFVQRWFN